MKLRVMIELLLTNLSFKNACTKVIVRHNEQHNHKDVKRYIDQLLQPPRKHNIFFLTCKAFNDLQVVCSKQLLPKS